MALKIMRAGSLPALVAAAAILAGCSGASSAGAGANGAGAHAGGNSGSSGSAAKAGSGGGSPTAGNAGAGGAGSSAGPTGGRGGGTGGANNSTATGGAGGTSGKGGSGSGGGTAGAGGGAGAGGTTGAGGSAASGCDQSGLVWKTGAKTTFTSYPAPGSDECIKYSGCMYEGQFAACSDTKPLSWVMSHNIVSVFPDLAKLRLHDLCLRSGSRTIVVTALDTCADSDCSGCCTQNKGSADELIDIESFTDTRWGVPDGPIEWADLGPTRGTGCQ